MRTENRAARRMAIDEVVALGSVTDVPTAGRALGMSRSVAYELARRDEFPCPVIRIPHGDGVTYRVPVAGLLRVLEIDTDRGGL